MNKEFDFGRVAMLLHVITTVKDWPRLAPIYNAAMAELEAMCYKEPEKAREFKPVPDKASHVEDEKKKIDPIPAKPLPPMPGMPDPNFPSGSLSPPIGVDTSTGRTVPASNVPYRGLDDHVERKI